MLGTFVPEKHTHIYGAGFSGLMLAYRLKKKNIPFTLFEKAHVGGKISTLMTPDGPVETAASTLYMNRHAEELLQELRLPFLKGTPKLKRWIWTPHGPVAPMNLKLLMKLFPGVLKKMPASLSSLSVAEVFLPLLGSKYVDELLSPALGGIHGAPAESLHFLSLFPFAKGKTYTNYFSFLNDFKKETTKDRALGVKGGVSFEGGMKTLIDALYAQVADHITKTSGEFSLETNTAICTSARDAAKLLLPSWPELSRELDRIEYLPMFSFTLFTSSPLSELEDSFGMLVPVKFGSFIMGVIHQSAVFPKNYPKAHCYTVIGRGTNHSEEEILNELAKKFSSFEPSRVLHTHLTLWKEALPLYNHAHFEALKNIRQLLEKRPGLILLGNYTESISLRSMIGQTLSI